LRLVYQDYSNEATSHGMTVTTANNGEGQVPAQYRTTGLVQYLIYSALSAAAGVHASFGRHAYVFAFGNGYVGEALTGQHVTDWRGTPEIMNSKILARKTGL